MNLCWTWTYDQLDDIGKGGIDETADQRAESLGESVAGVRDDGRQRDDGQEVEGRDQERTPGGLASDVAEGDKDEQQVEARQLLGRRPQQPAGDADSSLRLRSPSVRLGGAAARAARCFAHGCPLCRQETEGNLANPSRRGRRSCHGECQALAGLSSCGEPRGPGHLLDTYGGAVGPAAHCSPACPVPKTYSDIFFTPAKRPAWLKNKRSTYTQSPRRQRDCRICCGGE